MGCGVGCGNVQGTCDAKVTVALACYLPCFRVAVSNCGNRGRYKKSHTLIYSHHSKQTMAISVAEKYLTTID
ncbi:Protein of unknown function [Gryllus bimaculatus]|nr:Protein of unknown function [Gryllus bimaculatus]